MKVIYDSETDTMNLIFSEEPVAESDEVREGIVIDYGHNGELVSIEVLDASERIREPGTMVYQTTGIRGTRV